MPARLVLGSAQFGSDYGIVNFTGKVSVQQVEEILNLARRNQVNCIDTASSYGDAEQVLGSQDLRGFDIVTKIPRIGTANSEQVAKLIEEYARRSCANLKVEKLYGLMLHSARDLIGESGEFAYAGLLAARGAGLAHKIGISVYSAEEIDTALARYRLDIIQMPLSVLDQRLLGRLKTMADLGIEVHIRSVFLQGTMLISSEKLPERLKPLGPGIMAFQRAAAAQRLSTLEAAIAFVRDLPSVEGIVVGAAGVGEFRAIVAAFHKASFFDASGLALDDVDLVDPRRWAA